MGLEEICNLKNNAKLPKDKKKYVIPKKSAKKLAQEKEEKELIVEGKSIGGNAELNRWFLDRRKEMTGTCVHCGGKSCKDNDHYYKFSLAHILSKSLFPSVATHPLNYLELCHFGNSCHANMDNNMLDLIDMNCFDLVIERFAKMYPFIAPEERRRIPKILMEYVEVEK